MVNAKTITVDSGESRAQLYAELMKLSRGGSGASDHSFRAGASRFRIDVDGLHACSKILTVLPTTLAYKIDHRTAPNELLGAFSSTTTVTSTGLWLADAVFIMERLVDFSVPGGGELRMRIEANGGEKTKVITFKSECKEVEGTLGNGIPYAWVPATLTIGEEQNPVTRRRLIPVQFMSGTEPDHALDANISHLIQPDGFLYLVIDRLSDIKRYSTRPVMHLQSVMEHTGSVSLIAMVVSDIFDDNNIKHDKEKVLRLAIAHELDEVIIGDVPLNVKRELPKEHLAELRKAAMEGVPRLLESLKDTNLYRSYKELFEEEAARESMEYLIFKAADIVDTFVFYRREMEAGNKRLPDMDMENRKGFEDTLERIFQMHDAKLKYGPGPLIDTVRPEDVDWGPLA